MLIRRRVVQENPPQPDVVENNVTVVRPERPTGLLVGLGIATLLAIGAVTYLSWYLPNQNTYATQPVDSGRAERFESTQPAPKPNTVIINPPPVIQTPPPVVPNPPVVVTPPQHNTIIVPGASSSDSDNNTSRRKDNSSSNNNSNNGDDNTSGDVDGTVVGGTSGGQ